LRSYYSHPQKEWKKFIILFSNRKKTPISELMAAVVEWVEGERK
jgi:hypothetical protein